MFMRLQYFAAFIMGEERSPPIANTAMTIDINILYTFFTAFGIFVRDTIIIAPIASKEIIKDHKPGE